MGRRELERNLRLGKLFRRLGLGLSFSLVLTFGLLPRRSDGRAGARGRLEYREQRTHRRLREHRPVSLLRVQLRDFLVGPERPAHQLHRVDPALSRRSGSRRRRRRRRGGRGRRGCRTTRGCFRGRYERRYGRSRGAASRAPTPAHGRRARGAARVEARRRRLDIQRHSCAFGTRRRLRRRGGTLLLLAQPRVCLRGCLHVRREELRETLHDLPIVPPPEHLAAFLKGEQVRAELLEFSLERRVGGVAVAENARELRGGVHLSRVTGQVLRSRALRCVEREGRSVIGSRRRGANNLF